MQKTQVSNVTRPGADRIQISRSAGYTHLSIKKTVHFQGDPSKFHVFFIETHEGKDTSITDELINNGIKLTNVEIQVDLYLSAGENDQAFRENLSHVDEKKDGDVRIQESGNHAKLYFFNYEKLPDGTGFSGKESLGFLNLLLREISEWSNSDISEIIAYFPLIFPQNQQIQ